jgi:hypothetical protein
MKKLIAIATAGCMLMAASAPALAAPAVEAAPAQAAAPAQTPAIGTRAKLVQRASSTARGKSNKFLGLGSLGGLLAGFGSLFAVAAGAFGASNSDNPGSS